MTRSLVVAISLFAALAIEGCASGPANTDVASPQGKPTVIPEIAPGFPAGYLAPAATPNSLALLPLPPAAGSAALALDEDVNRESLALRNTPRGSLATQDADLTFPNVAGTFSCAVDAPITRQDTPHLYVLLQRTLTDAINATNTAKDHYVRKRPYLLNKEPLCAPTGSVGSYPSGHATAGWAWALIVTEMVPGRADAILARGRAFGQSRLICNAHWQSDVTEGRLLGAATVARLQSDPGFRADAEAGKIELAAARAKGLKPTRDCSAEAAAMALQPATLR